jgi:DNA-binding CsgD family transcriptional regulator
MRIFTDTQITKYITCVQFVKTTWIRRLKVLKARDIKLPEQFQEAFTHYARYMAWRINNIETFDDRFQVAFLKMLIVYRKQVQARKIVPPWSWWYWYLVAKTGIFDIVSKKQIHFEPLYFNSEGESVLNAGVIYPPVKKPEPPTSRSIPPCILALNLNTVNIHLMRLIISGKTIPDVAGILGIQKSTARQYMYDIKKIIRKKNKTKVIS